MPVVFERRRALQGAFSWAVLGLGLGLLLVNLSWLALGRGARPASASASPATEADPGRAGKAGKGPGGLPETVTLAEGKFKEARLAVEAVTLVALPTELGVPGRIDANHDRQVQVLPRAAGVIREVRVALGQRVRKGDVLAVLDSADVGTARLNLRAQQRALATVRFESAWKKQVAENVAALIPLLRARTESSQIIHEFANRPLGTFRSTLLDAYAKFDIATHEEEKQAGLRKERIVGEHPVYLAAHTRAGAQAVFEGAVEQARFDANQQSFLAAQQVRVAEAAVVDAAQRLRILGVPEDIDALLAPTDPSSPAVSARGLASEDVTAYEIAAPFDGTVITRAAVVSQKAEINAPLFTIADLSTVWVTANIPESDFALLPDLQDGSIRVNATAYPGRSYDARLLSIGATVDPTTRTVPMLAETPNPDGLLKIGMFVRILLDTTAASQAPSVPTAALVEIEGVTGVFVPVPGSPRTFAFRPVRPGRRSGARTVVASGLAAGDAVVAAGAFTLKSELILQNEEGED